MHDSVTVFFKTNDCFCLKLFLLFAVSRRNCILVCNKSKQPLIAFCEKIVLENNRYVRLIDKFVVKILEKYM